MSLTAGQQCDEQGSADEVRFHWDQATLKRAEARLEARVDSDPALELLAVFA